MSPQKQGRIFSTWSFFSSEELLLANADGSDANPPCQMGESHASVSCVRLTHNDTCEGLANLPSPSVKGNMQGGGNNGIIDWLSVYRVY